MSAVSTLKTVSDAAELASHLFTCLAALGAAWWFLYTTQFKPRIQFDLECRFFSLEPNGKRQIAEISFVFKNTGFVEHRIYDLSVSVRGLSPASDIPVDGNDSQIFSTSLFRRQMIVPADLRWYFVRPGVQQVITHQVVLVDPGSLIQVTAGFSYERRAAWPHTVRRIFSVSAPTAS